MRVLYSITFFILFMVLIMSVRPRWLFRADGTTVPFGVGPDKTLFSLGTLTIACAAISLFAFALVDLVVGRQEHRHMTGYISRVPQPVSGDYV